MARAVTKFPVSGCVEFLYDNNYFLSMKFTPFCHGRFPQLLHFSRGIPGTPSENCLKEHLFFLINYKTTS